MPHRSKTLVKICGLKTHQDIDVAIDAKADFIGLVFFPKSPRHLELDNAAKLATLARHKTQIVALLVNPDDAFVSQICKIVKPDYLQLHGSESPQRTADIKSLANLPIIKAIAVAAPQDFTALSDYEKTADLILLDAKPAPGTSELPGGNGICFDWKLLQDQTIRKPYMLAGGLTPDNIAEAIKLTHAPIVDVSSGVESRPGIKDHDKIRAFIKAAKGG